MELWVSLHAAQWELWLVDTSCVRHCGKLQMVSRCGISHLVVTEDPCVVQFFSVGAWFCKKGQWVVGKGTSGDRHRHQKQHNCRGMLHMVMS